MQKYFSFLEQEAEYLLSPAKNRSNYYPLNMYESTSYISNKLVRESALKNNDNHLQLKSCLQKYSITHRYSTTCERNTYRWFWSKKTLLTIITIIHATIDFYKRRESFFLSSPLFTIMRAGVHNEARSEPLSTYQ